MSMGAVLFRVGTAKGTELGGLYKSMPWTAGFCLVGAASISAFPLFSGFVTKSMVIAAAMEKDYFWTWIVLLFASAGVFHHAGIKIPYFAFFGHDSGKRCQEAPAHMLVAMAIATLPTPAEEDFCAKGAKFGPHNLHENRPGSMQTEDIIFATYHNAGLRIYDSRDAFQPKQIGYFVPPAPEKIVDQRPNPAQVIQSCDVFVDKEGLMYLTDTNAGLYILQFEGH